MFIADKHIKALCDKECINPLIYPFRERLINNNTSVGLSSVGYDLTLGPKYAVLKNNSDNRIIIGKAKDEFVYYSAVDAITLSSHQFILAEVNEFISLPSYLVGFVMDKSSLARYGLSLQNTVIEPGWKGILTLEIYNMTNRKITLPVGIGICQILFATCETPDADYSVINNGMPGKYQSQTGVQQPL
jgi:dCTP deaminase